MPRKCTGCDYTTDDPFLGKCPWCSKSLAIVSRGGNRETARTDWRRERPGRRSLRAVGGGWVPQVGWGVWLMIALVVGGLFAAAFVGGGRRAPARGASPAGKLRVGMPLRDAVLALEPTPVTDGLSLHSLLDADPDASGSFTYCDHSPMIQVQFRHGKVIGVSEMAMPFMAGNLRQVNIQLTDRGGDK